MIDSKIKKNFGFGCMRLPMRDGEVDRGELTRMVDTFLESGFNYFDTARGYLNEDLNGDRFIWNAQISRAFFRDRLIVAMKGYDMLAQISNIYHTSTPISTTEVSSNVVPRSFLLTLTWKMHK